MSRAAAGKATMWSAVDLIGRQAATFVVSIVLARLLTPADFGAVAIALFFAMFVMVVVQQGLSTAVIQRHGAADEEVSSIFWWNLILSAALSVALIAAGPAIAAFFGLPVLAPLMFAAAAQITLTAIGAVHLALLNRDLRFDAIAKAGIPATILSGVIGIILALNGAGVWALAVQLVSAAALNSAGLWIVGGWRPAAVLRASGLSEAIRFARWVSLSGGLEVLYSQGFALVLGKLYGPRDVGLYTRAASTQQLPGNVVMGIISRVALPLFAGRRDDPEALRRGLLSANRMATVISLPLLVGLALTADLVIVVLFGPQWVEAGPILAILAWAGVLYPISANNLLLLLASGRSHVYFRVEVAKKVVGVLFVAVGSVFGIIGLAWSQVAFSIAAVVINSFPSSRYFQCGIARQLADLGKLIPATALMGSAILAIRYLVDLPSVLELGVAVASGGAIYLVTGMVLRVHAFHEALNVFRSLRPGPA